MTLAQPNTAAKAMNDSVLPEVLGLEFMILVAAFGVTPVPNTNVTASARVW